MAEANDVAFISEPLPLLTARLSTKRFGTLAYLLFASWLYPAKTARLTLTLSLPQCWLLHFGAALFGAIVIPCLFVAITESPIAVLIGVEEVLTELEQNPVEVPAVLLGIALWIESILVGLAFVVFAWGAVASERLRDSYRHALKQVWLRTPHAVLVVVLICAVALTLYKSDERWQSGHPDPSALLWPAFPPYPNIPQSDPTYAAAQKKYKAEMREFEIKSQEAERAWRVWEQTKPWYLRNEEPLAFAAGFLGTGWWLAALHCAVGISREVASASRSPHCLWCGYDLTTMSLESRCPECGQSVESSLGDAAQPGAAWERRQVLGGWKAWWRTWRAVDRDVESFGRILQLRPQRTDHRRFFACHLPIIFLIGAVGMVVAEGSDIRRGGSGLLDVVILTLLVGGLFGLFCVVGTTLVTCGSASLIGWLASLRVRRNLLPAAMQISAYSINFLVVWAVAGAVIINGSIHLHTIGFYEIGREFTGIHPDALFFFSCVIPNAICGLAYLWIVHRGTHGARHANQ